MILWTVVDQVLKQDLWEEEKWSGAFLVHVVLLCCDDWIACAEVSSQQGRNVSVVCSASAGCTVLWCIFSYSCVETVWTSRSCVPGLAAHLAQGEPAPDQQHQLLTGARVKVYSDTQNLVKDWLSLTERLPLPVNIYTIKTVMGTVCKISLLVDPNWNPSVDFFIFASLMFLTCIHFFCFFHRSKKYVKVFLFFVSCMVWDDAEKPNAWKPL